MSSLRSCVGPNTCGGGTQGTKNVGRYFRGKGNRVGYQEEVSVKWASGI